VSEREPGAVSSNVGQGGETAPVSRSTRHGNNGRICTRHARRTIRRTGTPRRRIFRRTGTPGRRIFRPIVPNAAFYCFAFQLGSRSGTPYRSTQRKAWSASRTTADRDLAPVHARWPPIRTDAASSRALNIAAGTRTAINGSRVLRMMISLSTSGYTTGPLDHPGNRSSTWRILALAFGVNAASRSSSGAAAGCGAATSAARARAARDNALHRSSKSTSLVIIDPPPIHGAGLNSFAVLVVNAGVGPQPRTIARLWIVGPVGDSAPFSRIACFVRVAALCLCFPPFPIHRTRARFDDCRIGFHCFSLLCRVRGVNPPPRQRIERHPILPASISPFARHTGRGRAAPARRGSRGAATTRQPGRIPEWPTDRW